MRAEYGFGRVRALLTRILTYPYKNGGAMGLARELPVHYLTLIDAWAIENI